MTHDSISSLGGHHILTGSLFTSYLLQSSLLSLPHSLTHTVHQSLSFSGCVHKEIWWKTHGHGADVWFAKFAGCARNEYILSRKGKKHTIFPWNIISFMYCHLKLSHGGWILVFSTDLLHQPSFNAHLSPCVSFMLCPGGIVAHSFFEWLEHGPVLC